MKFIDLQEHEEYVALHLFPYNFQCKEFRENKLSIENDQH